MSSSWLYERIKNKNDYNCIKVEDLNNSNSKNCMNLNDYKQIGSYNWSNKDAKTIIVPGVAKIYNKPNGFLQLRKNRYMQMVDENANRHPSCPLEPLFRSVKICTPEFSFNNINFVTDRNNFRKLLDFVENKCDKSFRIDIQKMGNSLLLIRREQETQRMCDDYGKDFEEKYTKLEKTNDPDGSYRRIVTYTFGDFKMVVRFEVDCVLEDNSNDVNKLTAAMGGIQISNKTKSNKFKNSDLAYINYGEFKDESLVELTTKSNYGGFTFPTSKWNQMFFSKTDNLVVGWHQRGMLKNVKLFNFDQVTKECNRTTESTSESLNKLHDLLLKIKEYIFNNSKEDSNNEMFSIVFDIEKDTNEIKIFSSIYESGISTELQKEIISD